MDVKVELFTQLLIYIFQCISSRGINNDISTIDDLDLQKLI